MITSAPKPSRRDLIREPTGERRKRLKPPKTRRKWGVNVSLISLNFFADSRARARTRKSVRPAGALVTSAELVRREIRKLSNDELHQVRLDIETLLRERLG